MTEPKPKPDLWVRPTIYQPKKAEKEEDMSVDASPEELLRAVMRPVNIKRIGEDDK